MNAYGQPEGAHVGQPTAARLALAAQVRQQIADSAQSDGNSNRLWEDTECIVANINTRYSSTKHDGREYETDLHDLWFTYYHAAKNLDPDNPMLDRLVLQILQTREIGSLTRGTPPGPFTIAAPDFHIASTSNGVIWLDLPFLASDMLQFWSKDWVGMKPSNRTAFATFLAKLASMGACNDRISTAGLVLLRDTFEIPRRLGKWSERATDSPASDPHEVTIAALLPAATAWLSHAGHRLIKLSEDMWEGDCAAYAAGELFRNDALYEAKWWGLTPQRWIFWLKRLQQIRAEADEAGEAPLAEHAAKLADSMLLMQEERDSFVRRKLQEYPETAQFQNGIREFGPIPSTTP